MQYCQLPVLFENINSELSAAFTGSSPFVVRSGIQGRLRERV